MTQASESGDGPALSACAALVRRGDPDRFLSAMTAPPARRERLFALYAFNLELARIPGMVSEPMLGLIRLQWWREAVAEAFDGGPPRAHEVAAPLAATIRAASLPRAPFEQLLDARAADAEGRRPETRAALDRYLHDTGGALLALAAEALAPGAAGHEATAEAGYAFAAANLLRAVPALTAAGRPPFPDGVDAAEAGRALAADGLAALRRARRADAPKAARPAFRAGWRSGFTLRAAARFYDPSMGVAEPNPARARLALLWRAATGGW